MRSNFPKLVLSVFTDFTSRLFFPAFMTTKNRNSLSTTCSCTLASGLNLVGQSWPLKLISTERNVVGNSVR